MEDEAFGKPESLFDRILHWGLVIGAVVQILCLICVGFSVSGAGNKGKLPSVLNHNISNSVPLARLQTACRPRRNTPIQASVCPNRLKRTILYEIRNSLTRSFMSGMRHLLCCDTSQMLHSMRILEAVDRVQAGRDPSHAASLNLSSLRMIATFEPDSGPVPSTLVCSRA